MIKGPNQQGASPYVLQADGQAMPYPIGLQPPSNAPASTENLVSTSSSSSPLWQTDVVRDVQIAKWGLGALAAISLVFLGVFLGDFKDIRKDISTIQSNVAVQASQTDAIKESIRSIEAKMDDNADRAVVEVSKK